MNIGIIGKKIGMTRVFLENGVSLPVTVVQVEEHFVSQIKNKENDGYNALQLACGEVKAKVQSKAVLNHLQKAGLTPKRKLLEIRVEDKDFELLKNFAPGQQIKLDAFSEGQVIDVSGVTKGKGFAGAIKRHHFAGQDRTHGNSLSHRAPGSIGQRQTPGRVFKGKKMCGQLGNVNKTIQNLRIHKLMHEKNMILIEGAVPGAAGSYVFIKGAAKAKNAKHTSQ